MFSTVFTLSILAVSEPQFVVKNRCKPAQPGITVTNKTTAPSQKMSMCGCATTRVCGCVDSECVCAACGRSAQATPVQAASPIVQYALPSGGNIVTINGKRYIQQCNGRECSLVPAP